MLKQEANTIILELAQKYKKDDIRDLQKSKGKLFDRIAEAIEQLQENGEVGESVQPVVVIVKEKEEKSLF